MNRLLSAMAQAPLRSPLARLAGTLLFSLGCAASAQANVLWDESVDGDLQGNQGTPLLIGSFAEGANSALGQIYRPSNVGAQGDTFAVTLLAGQVLESLQLTITNSTQTDPVAATLFRAPVLGQSFANLRQIANISADGVYTFTLPAILGTPADTDLHLGLSVQFQTSSDSEALMDWRWDAVVAAPIPEAPAAPMLAAGLGLLAWWARRRHASH